VIDGGADTGQGFGRQPHDAGGFKSKA